MPGIEDLMVQLYQQRAMQTMQQSDAETGALVAQLQQSRATTLGPRGRGPVGPQPAPPTPPPTGQGSGSGIQLAHNGFRAGDPQVAQVSPYDNMSVYASRHDAAPAQANDLSADVQRGNAIKPQQLQGLRPDEIGQAYNLGHRLNPDIAPLDYQSMTVPRANVTDLVY